MSRERESKRRLQCQVWGLGLEVHPFCAPEDNLRAVTEAELTCRKPRIYLSLFISTYLVLASLTNVIEPRKACMVSLSLSQFCCFLSEPAP